MLTRKCFLGSLTACILTSGCATTEDANIGLTSTYSGRSVDEFFIQHGPPQQGIELSDGRRIFVWAEKARNYNIPSTAQTNTNVYGNFAQSTTTFSGGGSIEVQCQVKIMADKQGIIESIETFSDTVGEWGISRCAELFKSKNG